MYVCACVIQKDILQWLWINRTSNSYSTAMFPTSYYRCLLLLICCTVFIWTPDIDPMFYMLFHCTCYVVFSSSILKYCIYYTILKNLYCSNFFAIKEIWCKKYFIVPTFLTKSRRTRKWDATLPSNLGKTSWQNLQIWKRNKSFTKNAILLCSCSSNPCALAAFSARVLPLSILFHDTCISNRKGRTDKVSGNCYIPTHVCCMIHQVWAIILWTLMPFSSWLSVDSRDVSCWLCASILCDVFSWSVFGQLCGNVPISSSLAFDQNHGLCSI